jgi:hypothetical protein
MTLADQKTSINLNVTHENCIRHLQNNNKDL